MHCRSLRLFPTCVVQLSTKGLSTSKILQLRKAPQNNGKIFGINKWVWLQLKPANLMRSLIEAWMRRKWKNNRFSTMAEKERQNLFHRVSVLYAFITWTGVIVAGYIALTPKSKELKEEIASLPHQEELDKGGALWWVSTLKSPDELQNTKSTTVFRFKGGSYRGSEDIALKAKEVGQEIKADITGGSETGCDDVYLRKVWKIKYERDGGPTNQQLREQLAAQGYDYELALSNANRQFGIKTRYNKDGTVGKIIHSEAEKATVEDVRGFGGYYQDVEKEEKLEKEFGTEKKEEGLREKEELVV